MTTLTMAAANTGKTTLREEWRSRYRWCTRAAVVARVNGDLYGARLLEARAEALLGKMRTHYENAGCL